MYESVQPVVGAMAIKPRDCMSGDGAMSMGKLASVRFATDSGRCSTHPVLMAGAYNKPAYFDFSVEGADSCEIGLSLSVNDVLVARGTALGFCRSTDGPRTTVPTSKLGADMLPGNLNTIYLF